MEGSHRQSVHPAKPGKVTVAGHPSPELDPKTKSSTCAAVLPRGKHVMRLWGLMREAIELHLGSMGEDGDLIPEPSSVEFLGVA